ncbi:hypothetical protein BGZ70_008861 [Mortierella alpina]|uniref:PAS domain-containing protein n=1 Tax=Mortierella alpina TaxID=64518 RepID=A0A9P6J357_MORAP|nr:hypothetical protein BGZ70_008861 [Mortierella alpina]
MEEALSYISLHDLTPEARYLWASPSIEDCVGYSPEELVGLPPYDFAIKDDIPLSRVTHQENDMVASQLMVRYRHKNGSIVSVMCVFSVCYEFIVNCATALSADGMSCKQVGGHSAAMSRMVQTRKEEIARLMRHRNAFRANSWNPNGLDPEPRICMILNRFTRDLTVMYASPSCEPILHIDADHIIGKPFLVFIRADDLGSFVEQVDMAKGLNVITHIRLWFQSPNWPQEIPCEAILFGSSDGLVVVMRRCRPFLRRRWIESLERFDRLHHGQASSWESRNSSMSSDATTARTTTSTSSSSASSSTTHSSGASPPTFQSSGLNSYSVLSTSRFRIVPTGSIKRIIEFNDDQDLKPLAVIQTDDSQELRDVTMGQQGEEYFVQHVQAQDDNGHESDSGDRMEEDGEDEEASYGRFSSRE